MKFQGKSKIAGQSGGLLLVLAAFLALLYFANYDRPRYQSSDTSGIEYEVGRVEKILSDTITIESIHTN